MTRALIEEAISLVGSEAKLGAATGYTQHAIWRAKTLGRVSPEMAAKIDRATAGRVPKHKLRPDMWAAPASDLQEAS